MAYLIGSKKGYLDKLVLLKPITELHKTELSKLDEWGAFYQTQMCVGRAVYAALSYDNLHQTTGWEVGNLMQTAGQISSKGFRNLDVPNLVELVTKGSYTASGGCLSGLCRLWCRIV